MCVGSRDVRATYQTFTVDLGSPVEVTMAVDDNSQTVGKVVIPSGAFVLLNNSIPVNDITITIIPVADSQLRSLSNPVDKSRVARGYPENLQFSTSVISAAFQCRVSSTVQQPFPIPISYVAAVDLQGIATRTNDSCLATIVQNSWVSSFASTWCF